jgi:phosphatidylglycerophosphate synthase
LGPLERPALQWLAARMPAWVTPDTLTAVGVTGSVIIFAGYGLTFFDPNFLWLASFGYLVNWFGDSLDGTVARYRKIQRPVYGFFVDHSVDAVSEVLIFLGLGLSPYVRFDIACMALIGYLLMSVLVYLNTAVQGEFRISYAKIGPTEMRVIAIIANMLVYFVGNPVLMEAPLYLTVYDLIVSIIAIALLIAYLASTLQQARNLARLEKKPKRIIRVKGQGLAASRSKGLLTADPKR